MAKSLEVSAKWIYSLGLYARNEHALVVTYRLTKGAQQKSLILEANKLEANQSLDYAGNAYCYVQNSN